jgi:FkbM family methyltransferase
MKRVARRVLGLLPAGTVVPVLAGPLRGRRWIVGSAPHGAWLGTLERPLLEHFVGLLAPQSIVWDIGANVGLYSLAAAAHCQRIVAFEPLPRNVALLRRHLALNRITNVDIVAAAVGAVSGVTYLSEGDSPSEARVTTGGGLPVTAITLDDWRESHGAPLADVVKIDVEGAEFEVLGGGRRSLAHRPIIQLAVHGDAVAERCLEWLQRQGYRVTAAEGGPPKGAAEWICRPA